MPPIPLPVYRDHQRLLQPAIISSRTSSKRKRASELRTSSQSPSPASPSGSSSSSSASPSPSSPTTYFQGTVKVIEMMPTRSVRRRTSPLRSPRPELERRAVSVPVVEARSTDAVWFDSPPTRALIASLPSLSSGTTLSTISETPELLPDDEFSESPSADEDAPASPPSLPDNHPPDDRPAVELVKRETSSDVERPSLVARKEDPTGASCLPAPSSLTLPIDLLARPHTPLAVSSPLPSPLPSSPPIVVAKVEYHDPILPRRRRVPPPPPPPRRPLSRSSSLSSLSSEEEESADEEEVGEKAQARKKARAGSGSAARTSSAQSRLKKSVRVKLEEEEDGVSPKGDARSSLEATASRPMRGPSAPSGTSLTSTTAAPTPSRVALSVSRSITGSALLPKPVVASPPRVKVELGPLARKLLDEIIEGLRECDDDKDAELRKMKENGRKKKLRRFQGDD